MEFECDPVKVASNRRKHGVSFEEASTVFEDFRVEVFHDETHSTAEDRYIAVGLPEKVRVRSRRGSAVLRLRVSENVARGVCFAPFHWGALHLEAGAGALNNVTSRAIDPVSKQPELKACAVWLCQASRAAVIETAGEPLIERELVLVGSNPPRRDYERS